MITRTWRALAGLPGAVLLAALLAGPGVPAAAATASGLTAPGTVEPVFAHVVPGSITTNTHWSGYDATTGAYPAGAPTWPQPTVNCSQGGDVVFWVGLGGG